MALAGKVTVVAGGSGIVGVGIVFRLLEAGATVVVPCRSERSLKALIDDLQLDQPPLSEINKENLHKVPCNVAEESGAQALAEYVKTNFPDGIDHVVSSLGGWLVYISTSF